MSKIIQWNCNGLLSRKAELERFLSVQTNLPDVLCIQESFLNKNISSFSIRGYTTERSDRAQGQRGGLVTLVKCGLTYERLPNPTSIEAMIIQIKLQSGKVTIVNVYHAPGTPIDGDEYERLFQQHHRDSIILGDFNAYSTIFGATRTDARGRVIENLLDDYNMAVLNTGVGTYIRRSGEMSHLDISMASTNIARIANWYVHDDPMGSDHLPVIIKLCDPAIIEDAYIPQWCYRRANWDGFKKDCQRLMTSDLVDDDVTASQDRLVNVIITAADNNIPTVKPNSDPRHKYVPYWTDECTAAVKKRNKAKNKMQRTRDINDRQEYYRTRGQAQHTIKSAQKQYWHDYCSTLDKTTKISKVWSTVKSMSGVRSRRTIPTIKDSNITYDTNMDKAELFAATFAAVSSDENLPDSFIARREEIERQMQEELDDSHNTSTEENEKINYEFEMHEMLDALKSCKKNSAPGEDRISYEILKHIPRSCHIVILKFYNCVWRKGHLPTDWKESMIRPMLKPDKSPFNVASYRPVALTSTLCKLMEKMVSTRLRWWLEDKQLFNKFQSGFRKNRSTIDQILRLADDAHKAVHTKQYTLAVMIDLEKAFDLVWHKGLIHKMKKLGLKDNIVSFVSDFLSDRSIKVRIGSSLSRSYKLENGTPQGSAISPFLFLIMINDIDVPENNTRVKLSLFADDSAAWKSGSNLAALTKDIQRYLDRLVKFFERWGLKISPAKTVAIVFTRNRNFRPDDVKLTVGGCQIKVEKTVRFLGVVFDRAVTWTPHIDQVVARCNKRLNLLKVMAGTRWGASKDVLLTVYKALIRSMIDYGCTAYDTASQTTKSKLESVQSKALKICCGAMIGTPTAALQVECGQPPLALRRQRMMADYALKVKSIPDHPSVSILEDCWQCHYANYPAGREPFSVKANKIMEEIEVDDVPSVPPTPAPWVKPSSAASMKHLQPHKIKIRDYITDLWQEMWDYSDTGQFYRNLHPVVGYKIKRMLRPRHKDVQITRLRLGHAGLGEKLHKIGQRSNPSCTACHEREDVEHFLIHCPAQQQLQHKLRIYCRDNRRPFSVKSILTSNYCSDIIYDFIKSSGSYL